MKKIIVLAIALLAFSTPAMAEKEGVAVLGGLMTGAYADTLLFHGEPYLNSNERLIISSALGVFSGMAMGWTMDDLDIGTGVAFGTIGSIVGSLTSETINSYYFVSKSGEQFSIGIGGRF